MLGSSDTEDSPCRVLIVEDHADLAEAFALLVESLGHRATAVHTGEESFHQAERMDPDVIFIDLKLPGIDGYEVARRLRAAGSKALLVAFTGLPEPESKALEAGFDRHVLKPLDSKKLAAIVDDACARRGRRGAKSPS